MPPLPIEPEAMGEPDLDETGRHRGPVVFAAARVSGRRRGSSRLTAAAALAAALGLVGFGIVGRLSTPGIAGPGGAAASPAVPAIAIQVQADDPASQPPVRLDVGPDPVDFTVVRTADQLQVSGTIGPRLVSILGVETVDASGHVQARQALWVQDPDGGVRPLSTRTFHVAFPLSQAHVPAAWVQVTAYDAIGAQIGAETLALVPGSRIGLTGLLKVPMKVNETYVR